MNSLLNLKLFPKIYLSKEAVDFRNGINGLSSLVEGLFNDTPLNGALYVFPNKSRKSIKILYWDKTGFCLWQKRLEKNKYFWPYHLANNNRIRLSARQLEWILEGLNLKHWKPHPELFYKKVS